MPFSSAGLKDTILLSLPHPDFTADWKRDQQFCKQRVLQNVLSDCILGLL